MRTHLLLLFAIFLIANQDISAQQAAGGDSVYAQRSFLCELPIDFALARFRRYQRLHGSAWHNQTGKTELLRVEGTTSYQYFTRTANSPETPFIAGSSSIFAADLLVTYRQRYPYRFGFRVNNSQPFQLDNPFEIYIGADQTAMRQLIESKVSARIDKEFKARHDKAQTKFQELHRQEQRAKAMMSDPGLALRLAAEKVQPDIPTIPKKPELATLKTEAVSQLKSRVNVDSLKPAMLDSIQTKSDSIYTAYYSKARNTYDSLRLIADSLTGEVQAIQDSIAAINASYRQLTDSIGNVVAQAGTITQLEAIADSLGIEKPKRKNGFDFLSKTKLRVGKFLVSHSELTVDNIFLHGGSVQLGDERFLLISAGAYDFAFRNFLPIQTGTQSDNGAGILAVKLGKTDGRNLSSLNFYAGKKRAADPTVLNTIAGFSVEKNIQLDRHTKLMMEVAKSTTASRDAKDNSSTIKDLFTSFSFKTIGARAAGEVFLPRTGTDIFASYRYWGHQFESFNSAQFFNPQNNAEVRISQPFFQRKLVVTAGSRYADFSSYGIGSNLRTRTLFNSITLTARLKKLPVLSLGYYPGSQLYMMDGGKLYEYFYSVVNATASHYFQIGRLPVQVVATHNRFLHRYTDSLIAGADVLHNIYLSTWSGNFSYNTGFSYQQSALYTLRTIDGGLSWSQNKFRIGGTLKCNWLDADTKLGYLVNAGLDFGKLGSISLMGDRSFLPDRFGAFIPVLTGQVQYTKPLNFRICR